MMVKKSGLGLQDLGTSAEEKYLSSLYASRKMIGSVTIERALYIANNTLALRNERRDGPKIWYESNKAKLKGVAKDI